MNHIQLQQKYGLDNIPGPLAKAYGQLVPETIQTGAQISIDRLTDETLRNKWLYPANSPLATKRNGKLLFALTGNEGFNAVFGKDTEKTCEELRNTGYVHLNSKKRDFIFLLEKLGYIEFVEPKELGLTGSNDQYKEIHIRTDERGYKKDVTVPRMSFVRQAYGSGQMLGKVMHTLNQDKVPETIIYTMNPDNVAESVQDGEVVARASGLNYFGSNSNFDANFWCVDYSDGLLRGVLSENVTKGDAKKPTLPLEELAEKGTRVENVIILKTDGLSEKWLNYLVKKQ